MEGTLKLLHAAVSLRLPVPPIPPRYLLNSFLAVEKRSAFIVHRGPGSMIIVDSCISCAINLQVERIPMVKALEEFERCINAIMPVYFVAVSRRYFLYDAYVFDRRRKILLL